jgi:hypothetical protein
MTFHDKFSSSPCYLFFLFFIVFYSAGRPVPHSAQNTLLPFGIPHDGHLHPFSGTGLENTHASVSSANSASRAYTACAACAS